MPDDPTPQAALSSIVTSFPLAARGINWRGMWTLYEREVLRFLGMRTETVAAPVVTTLLFLAVFTMALGRGNSLVQGVPYLVFLAPGLTMMAIAQNAFANTSHSLVTAKMQGNIVDLLMPPLSALELALPIALGGVTRGLMVGAAVRLAMLLAVPWEMVHPGIVLFFALTASLMLALLGILGGIWAQKHDHLAAITSFVITPAAFLSGSFYSIERLPEFWRSVALLNPFFYMIDGFRYGFIGQSDGPVSVGILVMLAADIGLGSAAYLMFKTGYRLKA
jgi:ABC-2 type transport system permease protein